MRNVRTSYQENPFFRSTVNIVAVQTGLGLLSLFVFAFCIYHQQTTTQTIIDQRRIAFNAGQQLNPATLDMQLRDLRDDTLWIAFIALLVLTGAFGFMAARYALHPTRDSLEYQKRFIGNIAHELRTPLSIIRTNTEVALMDKSLEGYARDTLALTMEELDRISQIINNLLSFNSLLRAGHIKKGSVELASVLSEVVARHKALAETRGIALSLHSPKQLYVSGNDVALGQVFTNLVKNALNYTPEHDKRSVTVKAYEDEEKVSVSVIDTGIGIAQRDLYHVFEPFFRGDTSRERGIGSGTSGLGLAIVNDIVRAHNGSIIIRSALNRGTTIEITFPKAPVGAVETEANSQKADSALHEAAIVLPTSEPTS